MLIELFLTALRNEVEDLHENNIQLKFIGKQDEFPDGLRKMINDSEQKTSGNTGMKLLVAANYSGRWDITNACVSIAKSISEGKLEVDKIDESTIAETLSLSGLPDPDLLIRTGGEQRISNYLLWHCAYTELFFSDVLWPDFSIDEYEQALHWFEGRQRRFGRTEIQ
jgi:undecaprenyl diphosphate synthase